MSCGYHSIKDMKMGLYYGAIATITVALLFPPAQCAKSCLPIPSIPSFDLKTVTGVWYVYQTDAERAINKHCMLYNLTDDIKAGAEKEIVYQTWISDGKYETIEIPVTHVKEAEFTVDVPGLDGARSTGIVVEEKFSTWQLCIPGYTQEAILFVLTKDKDPDESIIKKAHDSLTNVGYEINSDLFKIDHSNC